MKAFNYMSGGPQDPTSVDWVKQLHGDLSARHRLHINRHHWSVYNKHTQTHTQDKNIPLRFDCQHCQADEINFLLPVMKGFLGDMTYQEAPRPRPSSLWTDWIPHPDLWRNTEEAQHSDMIEHMKMLYGTRQQGLHEVALASALQV